MENGEVRVCSLLHDFDLSLSKSDLSCEHLPAKTVDEFTLFPKQTETDILKVFSSSDIKGSLPRGICVKAIAVSLYLVMTVLLSFLKLMQNALGAVLIFDVYFCDKSQR